MKVLQREARVLSWNKDPVPLLIRAVLSRVLAMHRPYPISGPLQLQVIPHLKPYILQALLQAEVYRIRLWHSRLPYIR